MRKTILAVAVLLLSACNVGVRDIDGFDPATVSTPDPLNPNVLVVNGEYIIIDQEPIYLRNSAKRVVIKWRLAKRPSPYVFDPSNGITIGPIAPGQPAPVNLLCGPLDDRDFRCQFDTPGKGVRYKYSVMVRNSASTGAPPLTLDPTIVSN